MHAMFTPAAFTIAKTWKQPKYHWQRDGKRRCGTYICCFCSVTKSYPTLWDPMDCSPPGSCVHGVFQSRILECVAIFLSRGSLQPGNQTHVSRPDRQILYHWATREAQYTYIQWNITQLLRKNEIMPFVATYMDQHRWDCHMECS